MEDVELTDGEERILEKLEELEVRVRNGFFIIGILFALPLDAR